MKNRKFQYFIKKIRIPLIILALALSIIGSIQVYHGKINGILKGISVISISVLKLFSFFPTVGLLENKPLIYEIAIWLAPLSLAVGIFSIFTPIYDYFRQLFVHFRKDHIILMGNIDDSLTFIRNLSNEKDDTKIIYLLDHTDEINEDILTNLDVKIVRVDLINPKNKTNEMIVKDAKLNKFNKVINFDSDLMGFGRTKSYSKLLEDFDIKIDFFQRTNSYRLKEIMQKSLEESNNLDIHYFHIDSLIINHLIENKKFSYNITKGLKKDWNEYNISSIDDINKYIGSLNILILGFNDLTYSLLMQISNTGVINTKDKIDVDIFDPNASNMLYELRQSIREFDKVFNIRVYDENISSKKTSNIIKKNNLEKSYDSIFLCDYDLSKNIMALDNFLDEFSDTPIAIYDTDKNRMKVFLQAVKYRSDNISYFGDRSEVLTKKNIIDEKSLEKAKNFNNYYDNTMNRLLGYDSSNKSKEEKWFELNNIKKESSLNQTMHANIKKLIISKFVENIKDIDNSKELLEQWNKKLKNNNISKQVDIIEKDVFMNFLTSLEHKRWNNFYYMRDFVYDDIKNEDKKQHDCLIDSWDEFLSSKQRDKAIYDFLSSLIILDNE